jgi:hypothetical protein
MFQPGRRCVSIVIMRRIVPDSRQLELFGGEALADETRATLRRIVGPELERRLRRATRDDRIRAVRALAQSWRGLSFHREK